MKTCRRNEGITDRMESSRFSFEAIRMVHENPLLAKFRNPEKLLQKLNLSSGQTVVEVGCGPGCFTFPAAKIIGKQGILYAFDVNRYAIAWVEQKVKSANTSNIRPLLRNAAQSGLEENSVDTTFIFGLRYVAGGITAVVKEMARILKPGGLLAIEKTRGAEAQLIEEVKIFGFSEPEKNGRIYTFLKLSHN